MSPLLPSLQSDLISTLRRLLDTKESGELVFSGESGSRRFIALSGYFVDFISNCPEDDLARYLLSKQLISQDEYDVLALRARQGYNTERLILDSEIIEESVLRVHREARMLDCLLEIGLSPSPKFEFLPLSKLPRRAGALRLSLTWAILELVRKYPIADENEMVSSIGGEDCLLHYDTSGGSLPTHLPLTPQESFVLSRLSAPISFRQLLDIVPLSRLELLRILQALLSIDLISIEAPVQHLHGGQSESASPDALPAEPPLSSTGTPAEALFEKQRLRAEALLSELQEATPHQVLGVTEGASPDEIKSAYYRLAKEFHPDRFFSESVSREAPPSVRAVFQKIRDAYELLKNDSARRKDPNHPLASGASAASRRDPTPEELEKAARASHNQGVHFYQQHDFFAAVQHFREAVRIQPDVARYHHSLARALMRNPRWRKEAEEHFVKAIELDEFTADYRVSLGLLYLEAGMRRKAESQFRDALVWDSENQAARRELLKLQSDSHSASWLNRVLGRKKP